MSRSIAVASFLIFAVSNPALAGDGQETRRQLDAHEHGHSTLNIGLEGNTLRMELEAPGADIVGFEYVAETEADKAAVVAAKQTLSDPLKLFRPSAVAGCSLVSANVEVVVEGGHDDHDKEAKHDDHDDHGKEAKHDDHDDHDKEAKHDDHDDHDKEAKHDDHDDRKEAGHNEFHANYTLTCTKPGALKDFSFAFFETFKGAEELEVNVVSEKGQRRFEVERDAPSISLDSLT